LGVDALLVGSSIMKSSNILKKVNSLVLAGKNSKTRRSKG